MKNRFLPLCAAGLVGLSLPAFAQQRVLTSHVRDAVRDNQAQRLQSMGQNQRLKLSIVLPLRNLPELDQLLQDLYDPSSSSYHQWLSVDEFTNRFGPTQQDYDTLAAFASQNGLTITGRPANRMLLDVEGAVSDIQRAFHVQISVYRHPTENRTFYAPDREPTADMPLTLWHVEGLDNFSPPRPAGLHYEKARRVKRATTGSGPGGSFLGSDFRQAYYGSGPLNGTGQSIGLFGLGYNISDVQNYFNNVNQPFDPSVVQNDSIDGSTNQCGSGCDDGEPVVDIVSSLSMAPKVDHVIEYFGNGPMDTFNAMASRNVAKQLSASILYQPADPSAEKPIFQEMAAQGQSLFCASGDSGAWNGSTGFEYPAADSFVTAVGGTDLVTNGPGGSWQSETGWVGSSGGVNNLNLAIPGFQQTAGVINGSNGGSSALRNVPDVAAEANTDNWYCVNGNPCRNGIGGTSLAAPRWAGFLALVNQQAANNGKPSAGFLNPTIYGFGTGSNYGNTFHDIISGTNNGYSAVTGYDLVTGWGSPNGQGLIDALAPPPASNGHNNNPHPTAQ